MFGFGIHHLSVWLHIISAAVWVGGMAFLALTLIPVLRGVEPRSTAAHLLHRVGVRFRSVGWISLLLLVITGIVNLWARRVTWDDVWSGQLWSEPFGRVLGVKLLLVAFIFLLSAVHDFVVGPRATRVARTAPESAEARRLRRQASWMGRLNFLAGLIVIALGVMLVR